VGGRRKAVGVGGRRSMRSRRGRSRALAALGAWSGDVGLVQQSSSHADTQTRRHVVGS
jgi:hypothetical protein